MIQRVSDPFPPYLQGTFTPKPYELGSWKIERMFTSLHVSNVTCYMSHVTCHVSHVTIFSLSQSGRDSLLRVCYQRRLPRLVWIWNQSTLDNGEVSRGRSVAVGVIDGWKVTCNRWKVTCDRWKVTCDMWFVTHDKWFL